MKFPLSPFYQILVLLVLSGVGSVLTYYFHPKRPELYLTEEKPEDGEIGIRDALDIEKRSGVVWIDARRREEFEQSHVPGAILYVEGELSLDLMDALQDSRKPVVIYCDAQKCQESKRVAAHLKEFTGRSDIYVLHGGWKAWANR